MKILELSQRDRDIIFYYFVLDYWRDTNNGIIKIAELVEATPEYVKEKLRYFRKDGQLLWQIKMFCNKHYELIDDCKLSTDKRGLYFM